MSATSSSGTPTSLDTTLVRRVALSSLIGTAIEYYDFLLYASMAALVFGKVFFPNAEPALATVASFGTFAVGYLARPLGGIVFGHFGDRIGRKSVLVLTMTLMGVSSFLIGLLPTYASIGVTAPVLLVMLRLVQGVAIGGEWGGATLMVAEHAEPERRGFWNGIMQMGSPVGALLATAVVTAVTLLPEEALLSWGWRVPYLLSAALLGAGLYVRLSVTESPVFKEISISQAKRFPAVQVLRNPRSLLVSAGIGIGPFALTALLSTFMLSYATSIGYRTSSAMIGVLSVSVTALLCIPVFSALTDRVGRRRVVIAGALGIVAFAWPMYVLVDSMSVPLFIAAMIGGQILQSAMFAPLGALFSEMFQTAVRYTGASMGYQLAALVGAGLTPLIASALLAGDVRSAPLAMLAAGGALITLLAITRVQETRGLDLSTVRTIAAWER